jgi:hypothetical protein
MVKEVGNEVHGLMSRKERMSVSDQANMINENRQHENNSERLKCQRINSLTDAKLLCPS